MDNSERTLRERVAQVHEVVCFVAWLLVFFEVELIYVLCLVRVWEQMT